MDDKKIHDEQKVVVTDIRMPFWSMVLFMVKWVFASIPAMFIFSVVVGLIMAVLSLIFGSMWGFHSLFREGGLPM
ncbi:MAG: hypothetical protein WBP54_06990 [Pelodictyon phaeoclathratiforme]